MVDKPAEKKTLEDAPEPEPHHPEPEDPGPGEEASGACPPWYHPCDALVGSFPVPGFSGDPDVGSPEKCPGEPWCHLFTVANYHSSLLSNYPPPGPDEPPYLVNAWQQTVHHSPYRVVYGTHNPAVRGLVITNSTIVPNFSWTPRLALEPSVLQRLVDDEEWPSPVVMLPAVHGRVLRLFFHQGVWYIASNQRLESLPGERDEPVTSYLGMLFEGCLLNYSVRSLWQFVRDLSPSLCWFFAVYPGRQSLLFLGSCRILPHGAVEDHIQHLDLGFTSHSHLPASVPILPTSLPPNARRRLLEERLHNAATIQHTALPSLAAPRERAATPICTTGSS